MANNDSLSFSSSFWEYNIRRFDELFGRKACKYCEKYSTTAKSPGFVWETTRRKIGLAKMLRLFAIFAVFVVGQALTPSSFLSTVDKSRFKSLFQSSLADESAISYAILGFKLLGETAPNAGDLCAKLQAGIDKPDVSAATLFASSAAAKALGSCTLKPNAQAGQVE